MCKRDTESVKVAPESVLSNRGNLEGKHLTRFSPGGGVISGRFISGKWEQITVHPHPMYSAGLHRSLFPRKRSDLSCATLSSTDLLSFANITSRHTHERGCTHRYDAFDELRIESAKQGYRFQRLYSFQAVEAFVIFCKFSIEALLHSPRMLRIAVPISREETSGMKILIHQNTRQHRYYDVLGNPVQSFILQSGLLPFPFGIHNGNDKCCLFHHWVGRNATSLRYWLFQTCAGRLRRDGQCCGREAQCGRRTKINWTKTVHNIHAYACMGIHMCLVPTHTHITAWLNPNYTWHVTSRHA